MRAVTLGSNLIPITPLLIIEFVTVTVVIKKVSQLVEFHIKSATDADFVLMCDEEN